jgi:hypothetical protein
MYLITPGSALTANKTEKNEKLKNQKNQSNDKF